MSPVSAQTVANIPGALTYLVELLWKNEYPTTQMLSAMVLLNLAAQTDMIVNVTIVKWSGALEGLVHLLSQDENYLAQEYAVKALWYLTTHDENKLTVGRFSAAVQGLVGLLLRSENETLQRVAAKVLSNLASKDLNKHTIAHFRDARRGLVRSLAGKPSVRTAAAETVATLSAASENHLLSYTPGLDETGVLDNILTDFLPSLVPILLQDEDPSAQAQAVTALGNLARTRQNKFRISQDPLALQCMVRLMSENFSVDIQNRAATAIANLCELDHAMNPFSLR